MWGCRQITNAAFVHLHGIHTLRMNGCSQITNDAFEHLKGIRRLNIINCPQITDAAFVHLTLKMIDCMSAWKSSIAIKILW
jgi:hypothetical protein